jgi:hypothetical protein
MFQGLTQGSIVSILFKNTPRVADGRIVSVNTHMPTYNPQQPMALMNGPVTDLSVQIGDETLSFAGLPANGVVANFPDRGLFISTDKNAVIREVDAAKSALKQDLDQVSVKQKLYSDYEHLSMELNPELKKEAEQARELFALRNEVVEMRQMLSAILGTKPKEE